MAALRSPFFFETDQIQRRFQDLANSPPSSLSYSPFILIGKTVLKGHCLDLQKEPLIKEYKIWLNKLEPELENIRSKMKTCEENIFFMYILENIFKKVGSTQKAKFDCSRYK